MSTEPTQKPDPIPPKCPHCKKEMPMLGLFAYVDHSYSDVPLVPCAATHSRDRADVSGRANTITALEAVVRLWPTVFRILAGAILGSAGTCMWFADRWWKVCVWGAIGAFSFVILWRQAKRSSR